MHFWIKIATLFLAASIAYAAPPTPESVERLLQLDGSEKAHDLKVQAADTLLTGVYRQVLMENKRLPAAMRNSSTYDEVMGKVVAELKAALSWEIIKPQIVQVYCETYNQEEIDDLSAFYSSRTGQSFREKQPAATKAISVLMAARIDLAVKQQLPAILRLVTEANAAKRP